MTGPSSGCGPGRWWLPGTANAHERTDEHAAVLAAAIVDGFRRAYDDGALAAAVHGDEAAAAIAGMLTRFAGELSAELDGTGSALRRALAALGRDDI